MAGKTGFDRWQTRRSRWTNRVCAWRSGFMRRPTRFATEPEPLTVGSYGRGRQLVDGHFQLGGRLVEAPGQIIWDIDPADSGFSTACHGSEWLDDLAAAGEPDARERAQDWVWGWIDRYGRGSGPGWTPELTARRLVRWINHAPFLLAGRTDQDRNAFMRSLAHQTVYLGRRWATSLPGLPRFEALSGLICAGVTLKGMNRWLDPAARELAEECHRRVDRNGAVASRNPEELMQVLTQLTWAAGALKSAEREVPKAINETIEEIVPTLRALRHSDGALARFHGGGRGADGRLDRALASAGVRAPPRHGLAMGFARLTAGRTSLIIDTARPPSVEAAANAHASTLAFELTSGRRPLIVNCGSGTSFGDRWRRAGRATPSHSALCIEGVSSARLGRKQLIDGVMAEPLVDGPLDVWSERSEGEDEYRISLSHDGWAVSHGLTCFRELALTSDGRALGGDDSLAAMSPEERVLFDHALAQSGGEGIAYAVRFHLHPDAGVQLDLGETSASIYLPSGEVWVFRHDGTADLTLEPSVYLESGRLKPRPAQQIVLSARVTDYASHISWTLAKALDTPTNLRDVEMPDLAMEDADF